MFGFASDTSFGLRSLAFSVAVLAASPALSQPPSGQARGPDDGRVSIRVAYEDLDLTSEAGRKELQRRVKLAAWRSCTESAQGAALEAMRSECEATAAADAAAMQRQVIANAAARTYAGEAAAPVVYAARRGQ
jgi:UrcA family protein